MPEGSQKKQQRDEYLDAVLIGGREPVEIHVVEYDDAWPGRFEHERDRIVGALDARARRVEHIGSTSVPGLAAKPIIDIVVTVDDIDDPTTVADLENAGYVLRVREPDHRMVRTPARDVHIHIYPDDADDVERLLMLREQLRQSPEDRDRYAATKHALAQRRWTDMNEYADAKAEIIASILKRATERVKE